MYDLFSIRTSQHARQVLSTEQMPSMRKVEKLNTLKVRETIWALQLHGIHIGQGFVNPDQGFMMVFEKYMNVSWVGYHHPWPLIIHCGSGCRLLIQLGSCKDQQLLSYPAFCSDSSTASPRYLDAVAFLWGGGREMLSISGGWPPM